MELIVIAGPTASGKTQLAINIAKHLNTKIVSADSRQCYKEMNIGVAKPSAEELAQVEHYFINDYSIKETITAADFDRVATAHLMNIFKQHKYAVLVGGTGLYIKALCEGLDEVPQIAQHVVENIQANYNSLGIDWLVNQVATNDKAYLEQASNGEERNTHRLIRALAVKQSTGKSILEFRKKEKKVTPFQIKYHVIDWPREELNKRISLRVDHMMQQGLLHEATQLYPYRKLKNLQTIGYQELFKYFDKEYSLDEAVERLKLNTMHYAKRQVTWFKKEYPNCFAPASKIETLYLNGINH